MSRNLASLGINAIYSAAHAVQGFALIASFLVVTISVGLAQARPNYQDNE